MTHNECVRKLIEIGKHLGFYSTSRSYGKTYHMGNPDCVWYYKGKGAKVLRKIAKGDKYGYLPLVAFEVPFSENEKALRGSLMTLQLTNASASVFVPIGRSAKHRSFLKKLVGRFSATRFRIWSEKDVDELYDKVVRNRYGIAVGEKSHEDLKRKIASISRIKIKVSGRSYKTGKKKTVSVPVKDLLSG